MLDAKDMPRKEQMVALANYGSHPDAKSMMFWIQLIVENNLPFRMVECPLLRTAVAHKAFDKKTVQKYVELLSNRVTEEIKASLPEKFGVMFDGWADGFGAHYVAVIACFSTKNGVNAAGQDIIVRRQALLAMQPLLEETNQNADNHIAFIRSTLRYYSKDLSNIGFFVGDNCNTNKSISSKTMLPMIGCAAHRLNLAAKLLYAEHEELIDRVHELMRKLHSSSNLAKLRQVH